MGIGMPQPKPELFKPRPRSFELPEDDTLSMTTLELYAPNLLATQTLDSGPKGNPFAKEGFYAIC